MTLVINHLGVQHLSRESISKIIQRHPVHHPNTIDFTLRILDFLHIRARLHLILTDTKFESQVTLWKAK